MRTPHKLMANNAYSITLTQDMHTVSCILFNLFLYSGSLRR